MNEHTSRRDVLRLAAVDGQAWAANWWAWKRQGDAVREVCAGDLTMTTTDLRVGHRLKARPLLLTDVVRHVLTDVLTGVVIDGVPQ
ncbi:hypothetical protein ABH920_008606 [Catenulispora sp. EB89]|uniref:hypothetical protein n=1 Tax=Catenulispora sp. EB89 TaxID=3156257 RepID=UPI00351510D6